MRIRSHGDHFGFPCHHERVGSNDIFVWLLGGADLSADRYGVTMSGNAVLTQRTADFANLLHLANDVHQQLRGGKEAGEVVLDEHVAMGA